MGGNYDDCRLKVTSLMSAVRVCVLMWEVLSELTASVPAPHTLLQRDHFLRHMLLEKL